MVMINNTDFTSCARDSAEGALAVLSGRFFDHLNAYVASLTADWGVELWPVRSAGDIAELLLAAREWTDTTDRWTEENSATTCLLSGVELLVAGALAFSDPGALSTDDVGAACLLAAGCSVVADITEAVPDLDG